MTIKPRFKTYGTLVLAPHRLAQVAGLAFVLGSPLWLNHAQAQTTTSAAPTNGSWQQCATLTDDREARLGCFDRWATQQPAAALLSALPAASGAAENLADNTALVSDLPTRPAEPAVPLQPVTITMLAPAAHNCKNPQFSEFSRFWELEAGSDCGTFAIRGYRPISLSWIGANSVNTQPSSSAPAQPYNANETRIQLSVRTKIAQGLLTQDEPLRRDSLWFGYTQQSYWQLFNSELSRPFRTTDHEPEITYIYPTDAELPGGWRLRYSGLSVVHQSNGQSLPFSRSWNRTVLMAGIEKGKQFQVQARLWRRMSEAAVDDDNPGIENYIGRAEVLGLWNVNQANTLGATLRHSLRSEANGSVRLEWLRAISEGAIPGSRSDLRFHTQLFSGYGDSLIDYNRRRTVLSIGLTLVDW